MIRPRTIGLAAGLLALLGVAAVAADWYSRVKLRGVREAAAEDVALYEQGRLRESLHVGDCFYHLERWQEGVDVFRRLRSSPDRNYAASARVREAEGLVRLGRIREARERFGRCLERYPEAFLDIDIPTLCRAWLEELKGRKDAAPEPPERVEESEPGKDSVRQEIDRLESEIADLRERLASLRKRLSEGD